MNTFRVVPLAPVRNGDWVRSSFEVSVEGAGARHFTLWFDVDAEVTAVAEKECDSAAMILLMDAMREGADIHFHGSIDRELIRNLEEYQRVWNKWLPDLYAIVNITADEYRDAVALNTNEKAISAFSGGVDATFTAWMHTENRMGHSTRNLQFATLVHGFDIPLNDEKSFDQVTETVRHTLDDVNVQLFKLRTNFRNVSRVNWEHSFAAAVAAALSMFRTIANVGLIGSSEDYNHLILPWGSTPIADPLLSSKNFRIVHDGAGFSRSEKVEKIADWPKGTTNLRVCWAGKDNAHNCGQCEKCIRTKLNYLVSQDSVPDCFPKSSIKRDIYSINTLPNKALVREWKTLQSELEGSSKNAELAKSVARNILKCQLLDKVFPPNSPLKNWLSKLRG